MPTFLRYANPAIAMGWRLLLCMVGMALHLACASELQRLEPLWNAPDGQGACVHLHFPNREASTDAASSEDTAPVAVNETA